MAYVRRYDWFAGKLVGKREDRLGTVETGSRFYPYGDESPATGQDEQKFATYWRDSNTGLDYAMARYYSSGTGRFLTPDPYRGSASVARSGSWNRYAYVEGDPVNKNDPSGLMQLSGACTFYAGRWLCPGPDSTTSFAGSTPWGGSRQQYGELLGDPPTPADEYACPLSMAPELSDGEWETLLGSV